MRRGFGGPFRRGSAPNIPPLLQKANRLMSVGDYNGAAAAFEELASRAEGRGGPRAPFFYLQAGRTRLLAGQKEAGVEHIRHGLNVFAQRQQFQRLFNTGNYVIADLNGRGMTKEASDILAWLKATLPAGYAQPRPGGIKPILPTHCPGCGAPVHPDEVEWVDNITAECAYCGSPMRSDQT